MEPPETIVETTPTYLSLVLAGAFGLAVGALTGGYVIGEMLKPPPPKFYLALYRADFLQPIAFPILPTQARWFTPIGTNPPALTGVRVLKPEEFEEIKLETWH